VNVWGVCVLKYVEVRALDFVCVGEDKAEWDEVQLGGASVCVSAWQ
jgi:hypothetical protein